MASPVNGNRPVLLFTSLPFTGHITPTLRIASTLHARGWPVFYLGPTAHKTSITGAGVSFLSLLDDADFNDVQFFANQSDDTPEETPLPSPPASEPSESTKELVPSAPEPTWRDRIFFVARETILRPIPSHHRSIVAALVHIHSTVPNARVIVMAESVTFSLLPLFHSAPLPESIPRPIGFLALNVMIPTLRSVNLPPLMGTEPVPFDTTIAHKEQIAEMWKEWAIATKPMKDFLVQRVEKAGGKDFEEAMDARERAKGREEGWLWLSGEHFVGYDHVFQVGVESWFYKTEEGWPANWQFVGTVPKLVPALDEASQSLVDEVKLAKDNGKKVIVVTQGTVEINPRQLIIPTIQALGGRENTLVVAILGHRGRKLPKSVVVPENVKVTDYLPYDSILPYADVFVNNAGYGAVMHGIGHGLPMVVAGEEQDKRENSLRVEWVGHGIKIYRPWSDGEEYVDELRGAVEKVLDEEKGREVRERARELMREADAIDPVATIEDRLLSYL
ncbi:hypothetical protein B0T20DRAFT_359094 [Sordaria brevicollis]|uniref:Erythromycin biosynthesis protein CIII-like C-terminal domain-containing protein n=1 Tax=Sordaria brevicollis TaxID=83679 RepID=A0AAE0P9U0_SORBR|nr:hypothetical protein B0T20DRAFT_359094 [Sordaria brevicollis]